MREHSNPIANPVMLKTARFPAEYVYFGEGKMIERDDIVLLSKKEFAEVVEIECQKRLGMSTLEYLRKRGELAKSVATQDIDVLLGDTKQGN